MSDFHPDESKHQRHNPKPQFHRRHPRCRPCQNRKSSTRKRSQRVAEKQENPFIGTILAELTDQIRQMRETYGLGYLKIAEQLNSLKIEPKIVTSEQEIRKF
ncbi:hypothetical protein OH491_27930 (plasmid) [Termitidicoccus mucosus]|uniref:hypothetical protein n=1 Tax=Termitidicoccus mucosus TaxID=1184151 RepID=UPI00318397E3